MPAPIADRFDRRWLLLGGQVLLAANFGVLALLAWADVIQPWHIGIGSFINGVVFCSEYPVRRAMIGEVAGADRVGRAMGIDQTAYNATRILGPALGGLAYEMIGITGVFAVVTAGYAVCTLLMVGFGAPPRAILDRAVGIGTRVLEGLRYVRSHRQLMGNMAITITMNIWGFPYARNGAGGGTRGIAPVGFSDRPAHVVRGRGCIGRRVAGGRVRPPASFHEGFFDGTLLALCAVTLFGLSRVYELSLALTLVGGFGTARFSTMQSTLPYVLSTPEMRARVMGVLSVAIGTGPIGVLHVGLLAEWFGAANAVVIMGAEGILVLGLIFLFRREVR